MAPTIEIHRQGRWQPAATLQVLGNERCLVDYLPGYIFSEAPQRLALNMPVEFQAAFMGDEDLPGKANVPPFLYDLVPQGRGRAYLLKLLKMGDSDDLVLPLLSNGAFNPIGRLRINTAVEFYAEQVRRNPDKSAMDGFDIRAIQDKAENFLEHLALHAMLSAGTTGVQGVAPKFLLTQDQAGKWFADMALPDERATKHWMVKLPRGRTEDDLLVHRHEAAYLRTAAALGLRTHGEPMLLGRMLFTERFDRRWTPNGIERLHQESLASLSGLRGFGTPTSQNQLLAALRQHASDPTAETIEFLKRDVFNLALRNTDNHARNTAVQVLSDGTVQLTPVYDVSPMFLDPEVIARSTHWRDADERRIDDWTEVLESLNLASDEANEVLRELRDFANEVEQLPDVAKDCGVEARVLEACRMSIDKQLEQLQRLPSPTQHTREAHHG